MKAVLEYLTTANRPYSTNDVFLNLHKEHGKPAVQRVIDQMVTDNKLKVKLNGKQSCYFVNQDSLVTCSEEELVKLDSLCKDAEDKTKSIGDIVKQKESKLKSLTSSLTNTEAVEELNRLQEENMKLLERLSKLENNQEVRKKKLSREILSLLCVGNFCRGQGQDKSPTQYYCHHVEEEEEDGYRCARLYARELA